MSKKKKKSEKRARKAKVATTGQPVEGSGTETQVEASGYIVASTLFSLLSDNTRLSVIAQL